MLGEFGQPLLDVVLLGPDPFVDDQLVVIGQVTEYGTSRT
jgi:hypothetical protein